MKRVKKAFTRPLKTAGLNRVNNCCGAHLQDQACSLRVGDPGGGGGGGRGPGKKYMKRKRAS
jgi:hypothetical protein